MADATCADAANFFFLSFFMADEGVLVFVEVVKGTIILRFLPRRQSWLCFVNS